MRVLFLLIAIFYANTFAFAQNSNISSVHNFVEQNSSKVITTLQSGDSDKQKAAQLETIFVNLMDIDWMGKFAIGKFWKELDQENKIAYLGAYRKYLIASYIPLFKKYQNQDLSIKSVKALDGDQFSVITEIKGEGQKAPYSVEYKVKYLSDNYKVRDIIAENVSLLATQRADFGSIVSSGGIKNLITKLEEKSNTRN